MWGSGSEASEHGEMPVYLRRDSRGFITQPQIDRQVRPEAPVVLNIPSYDRLAKSALRNSAGNRRTQ